jgi:hypothetical protein
MLSALHAALRVCERSSGRVFSAAVPVSALSPRFREIRLHGSSLPSSAYAPQSNRTISPRNTTNATNTAVMGPATFAGRATAGYLSLMVIVLVICGP